jgi:hypothetical protein
LYILHIFFNIVNKLNWGLSEFNIKGILKGSRI